MRIIFMGTPDFAVPSLELLIRSGWNVVAVITSTDKWGGRNKKILLESAVKKTALEYGIPILQPSNLKAPTFLEELARYKADLQIVVAFRMLPEFVWNMPRLGTINVHASLLPAYRGAAPINWAIIRGETKTGLTIFQLKQEIDTGQIIDQKEVAILPDDTATSLYDRMKYIGAELLIDAVEKLDAGSYHLTSQDETMVSSAPKIFHSDCEINFARPVDEVYNFIRGLSTYPCAWTQINGVEVKIIRARIYDGDSIIPHTLNHEAISHGSIHLVAGQLLIRCIDGFIEILEIKPSGRQVMSAQDYINGNRTLPAAVD